MAAPRVLIDATSVPPNRGGVARYIAGLLQGLADIDVRVDVIAKPVDIDWLRDTAPAHRYHRAPRWVNSRPLRFLWEQVGLPAVFRSSGADVLHSPHYTFPITLARRTVVTLHDATFFSDPSAHSRLKVAFFRTWTKLARGLSRATVAPSESTVRELNRLAGRARRPTVAAHLGVDSKVFHAPTEHEIAAFCDAHGIPSDESWIAFLGTIEPRKRVPALIEAHHALHVESPSTPPLLVAGGMGWDSDARELLDAAGDHPGEPLRYLGYLPLDELRTFLGGARVVVYPSIAEGFGLPVLEAMASRADVLTTARLAIPEIGGDAVTYTEPDATSIRSALAQLLADPADARSERIARAGSRADGFTWAACARKHLEVYA